MKQLPQGIWLLIASYAHPRDLPSLARVSRIHPHACRPILYRNLSLRNSRSADETISLLGTTLALRIERLELITDAPISSLWPPLKVIKHMKNLRILTLREASPFTGAPEQQEFVSAIAGCCPKLEEIEVDLPPEVLDEGFDLHGIRKVRWTSSSDSNSLSTPFSDRACRCLLLTSQSTLTHISFPGDIDDFEAEHIISFSTLHFPALQSLVLGTWIDVDSPEIPTALTRFLVAHPTLTEVSLGYSADDEYRIDLDPNVLQAATTPILPALRRLKGHPASIRDIAVHSLTTLELGSGHDPNVRFDFADLFDVLRGKGGLPNVKKLAYYAGVSAEDDMDLCSMCMDGLSALCPQVEVWVGDLPRVGLTLWSVVNILSKFANLRTVFLRSWGVPAPQNLLVLDVARAWQTNVHISNGWSPKMKAAKEYLSYTSRGTKKGA
ncbi:hypothetical protein NLJ89_g8310 [Agrocybe chaxingu]|uniref:F-box domain-containing protein n=1 Tax=Agrocybe chaxingu TaxID=84603 RepID=A0A9W8JV54_9AGAR|nr:hypothetical protein NLJ89_g8310 [Agrocybe chaxingu]